MSKHTIPFIIFKKNLEEYLISIKCFDKEWFESQSHRINIWWNAGETMEGAKEMIEIFARGKFDAVYYHRTSSLNPIINLSERKNENCKS